MNDFAHSLMGPDPAFTLCAWLASGFAVERFTEIVVSSKLTDPFRGLVGSLAYPPGRPPSRARGPLRFAHALLSCGYCFSVWAASGPASQFGGGWLAFVTSVMIVHGAAVLWHGLFRGVDDALTLLRAGRVHTVDLTVRHLDEGGDVRETASSEGEDGVG